MKKKLISLLVGCLTISMLAGCGSDKASSYTAAAPMYEANGAYKDYAAESYYEESYAEESYGDSAYVQGSNAGNADVKLDDSASSSRKLIKTVNLEVETKEFDSLMGNVETQVITLGGYIENMDSYNGSSYSGNYNKRYANLTIRIPQNKLQEFLNTVSDACNVIRRNDSVNDVTLSYVDTQSRRDALKVEQDRLLEMLKVADNLQDMLILEERMTSVRYQLESLESQLRSLDNKVTFSTVYLNVSEVKELTPVVIEEPTTWERIRDGFIDSVRDIADGAIELFVWFTVNSPRLVIWAVIIIVAVVIIKKIRKKKAAKKAEKYVSQNEPLSGDADSDEK